MCYPYCVFNLNSNDFILIFCIIDWGLTPVENNHIEQPDLGYVLFRDDYVSISSIFQLVWPLWLGYSLKHYHMVFKGLEIFIPNKHLWWLVANWLKCTISTHLTFLWLLFSLNLCHLRHCQFQLTILVYMYTYTHT